MSSCGLLCLGGGEDDCGLCNVKNGVISQECSDETSKIIAGKLSTYPGAFVLPRANGGAVIAMVESNRTWLYEYVPTNEAEPLKLLPPTQSGRCTTG